MSQREEILNRILELKAIAVIRMADSTKLISVVEAILEGGVECVEITMTVPDAIRIIKDVSREIGDRALIGAGTVMDPETALQTIEAGAQFVVGPVFSPQVVEAVHDQGFVAIPGAFSPAEIVAAWEAGADVVKIFPATVLGPKYIKDFRGPLPQIRLCPTGGVTVDNVGEWIKAGASCVGIGSDLLNKQAIADSRFDVLTERARRMVTSIQSASS
jgi:2-dehydro-3-deoxyphosphogluconate aldolase/(4S)-4-hydroxy-2-oxoglutarate aldolase